jgi:hypothetical protein
VADDQGRLGPEGIGGAEGGTQVPELVSPYRNPRAKLFMALVIAANASAVAPRLRFDDPGILLIALLCVILMVLGFTVSKSWIGSFWVSRGPETGNELRDKAMLDHRAP